MTSKAVKRSSFVIAVMILLCIAAKLLPLPQWYRIEKADDFLSEILNLSAVKTYKYDERGIIGESREIVLAGGISKHSGITSISYRSLPDIDFKNISNIMFSISIRGNDIFGFLDFYQVLDISAVPNKYKESIVEYDGISFIITVSDVAYDIDDSLINFLLEFCEVNSLRTTRAH